MKSSIIIFLSFICIAQIKAEVVYHFDISNYTTAIVPKGHGQKLPLKQLKLHTTYPSRDQSMQLMMFFGGQGGILVRTTEIDGQLIEWEIKGGKILHITGLVNEPIVEAISSWQEGATKYKKWAKKQSWYKPKKDRAAFDFIATSSSNIYKHNLEVLDSALKVHGRVGSWMTQWRNESFDVKYPSYHPSDNDGFNEYMHDLKRRSVTAIPYFNGLYVDTHYQDLAEYYVRDERQRAIKYNKKLNHLVLACPDSNWRSHLRRAYKNIFGVYESKNEAGIYLDVVSATRPKLCHSSEHNHQRADRKSWVKSIKSVLSDYNGPIIVEGNAEVYIPFVDGFLMHRYTESESIVPLWQAVYGEIAISYGWNMKKIGDKESLAREVKRANDIGANADGSPWMTQRADSLLFNENDTRKKQ